MMLIIQVVAMQMNVSKSISKTALKTVYMLLILLSLSAFQILSFKNNAFFLTNDMKESIERNLLYYRVYSFNFSEQLDKNGSLILNDFSGINLLLPSGCSLDVDYKVLDTLDFNGLILVEGDHHGYRYSCDNGKIYQTKGFSVDSHIIDDSRFLIGILGEDMYFISGAIFCHASADILVSESESQKELIQFVKYKLNLFGSGEVVMEYEDDLNFYFKVSIVGNRNDLRVKMPKTNFDALTIVTDGMATSKPRKLNER